MSSLDLACAARARSFCANANPRATDQALLAAAVLRDHGVYALFRSCVKMGARDLAQECLEFLRDQGVAPLAACGGEDACKQAADALATNLGATYRAHRLLTRFLDYVYVHARGGAQ